jgi:hypothetical protein
MRITRTTKFSLSRIRKFYLLFITHLLTFSHIFIIDLGGLQCQV